MIRCRAREKFFLYFQRIVFKKKKRKEEYVTETICDQIWALTEEVCRLLTYTPADSLSLNFMLKTGFQKSLAR